VHRDVHLRIRVLAITDVLSLLFFYVCALFLVAPLTVCIIITFLLLVTPPPALSSSSSHHSLLLDCYHQSPTYALRSTCLMFIYYFRPLSTSAAKKMTSEISESILDNHRLVNLFKTRLNNEIIYEQFHYLILFLFR